MYEMKRQITYSQVGQNLLVDMAMLTHFFQDCALFHSDSLGKGVQDLETQKKAWFLSGWQIEVLRYPAYGETIQVRTWPHGFKGLYGYRNFDIIDQTGKQMVKANSIWIFMDLLTGRPVKPEPEDLEGYDISPSLDMEYAPRKITILKDAKLVEAKEPLVIRKSFIDSNQHVNNARYVTEALDYFEHVETISKMRVDYRKSATIKDCLYPVIYQNELVTQLVFEDEQHQPFVILEIQDE